MGEGEIGGGLANVCTPHICNPLSHSPFSFLHSAVEASFDIKKACAKPHTWFRTGGGRKGPGLEQEEEERSLV
jgi:hypothetical protein